MPYTGPYDVGTSGETYATVGDAITQAVSEAADIEGILSPAIELYNAETFNETPAIPQYATLGTTRDFPLIIRSRAGEGTATINGQLNMASSRPGAFEMRDLTLTGFELNLNYNERGITFRDVDATIADAGGWSNQFNGLISWIDSTLDITSRIGFTSGRITSWLYRNCEIRTTGTVNRYVGSGANGSVGYENCRVIGPGIGSGSLLKVDTGADVFVNTTLRQSAFYNFQRVLDDNSASRISMLNNIFHTIAAVKFNDAFTPNQPAQDFDGNRYYTVTKILDSAGTDYADLAAMQAAGFETNGAEGDPDWASLVWDNANFLKLNATLGDAKNVGIYIDAFGTARTKYSDIDPGPHQFAAATEPSANGIIKSAGGNWNDDNITDQTDATANFRTALAVGLAWTGGLAPGGGASTAATALAVVDTAAGITWTVTATGAGAAEAVYIYNQSGDALITILDGTALTADLTAGQSVYCKILEVNKTLSTRFPVAAGITVPALSSMTPTAPTQNVTVAGDTTMTLDFIADDGADEIYAIWREAGDGKAWTSINESFKRTGSGTISVTSLTNGTQFRFVGINKDGDFLSIPSNARWGTPTTAASAMTPEEAVRKLLTDDTEVSELISSRVYAQHAPQKAPAPYIVYSRVSGDHLQHTTAPSGLASTSIQLDMFGVTYSQAKDLAEEVRLALDGFSGVVSTATKTITIKTITIATHTDGFEIPPAAGQKGIHRVIMDFAVWYTETVPTF